MTPQKRADIEHARVANEASRSVRRRRRALSSATKAAVERLDAIERIKAAKRAGAYATAWVRNIASGGGCSLLFFVAFGALAMSEARPKHFAGRDVPHPHRQRERVERPDGTSFPAQRTGHIPQRPAISMLFEDLHQPDDGSTGVLGMYPASLIPKLLPWLRCKRSEVLHVCSGGLPKGEGIRVDVRAAAKPDVIADGRALPFRTGSIEAVLLDPPYTEHYARDLYGTDYPRPSHLLREAARVVKHGGRIGFVHYIVPNAPPGCRFVKAFGLSMGFGYPMRAVTFFEREQEPLFVDEARLA